MQPLLISLFPLQFFQMRLPCIPGMERAHTKNADEIEALTAGIELRDKSMGIEPIMYVSGHIYGVKDEQIFAKEVLGSAARKSAKNNHPQTIGKYRGFDVLVHSSGRGRGACFFIQGDGKPYTTPELRYEGKDSFKLADFGKRLDKCLERLEARQKKALLRGIRLDRELDDAKGGGRFPKMEMLNALRSDNRQALIELRLIQKDPAYKSAWKPKSWDLAKAQEKALAKAAAPAKQLDKDTPKEKGKGMDR